MQRAAHQLLLDGPEHAAVPRVAASGSAQRGQALSPVKRRSTFSSSRRLFRWEVPAPCATVASVLRASGPTRARSPGSPPVPNVRADARGCVAAAPRCIPAGSCGATDDVT